MNPRGGWWPRSASLLVLFLWLEGPAVRDGRRVSRQPHVARQPAVPDPGADHADRVVHYTPEWVGRKEHSIHIAHISSVSIDTNLLFSNVLIETSGGTSPVRCHGHRKTDAVRMKPLIEQYQTQYYRAPPGARERGPMDDVTFAARRATSTHQPARNRPMSKHASGRWCSRRCAPASSASSARARRDLRHRSDDADLRPNAPRRRELHPRAGRVRRGQEDRRRPADVHRGHGPSRARREPARRVPRRPRQPRHRGSVAVGAALPRDDRPRREDAGHLRVDPDRRQVRHLGADPRARPAPARKSWRG